MRVISIVNRKGGVGKTATALALAAGLRKRNKKVLIIDLDSQMNLSFSMNADFGHENSMDILTKKVPATDAIQHTKEGDLIAACPDLAKVDITLTTKGKEYKLKEAICGLKYDYVIIDTPGALSTITTNALTAADVCIIPGQADVYSIQALKQVGDTIETVQKYCNSKLKISGLLLTRYNDRTILSKDMKESMSKVAKELHTTLFKTTIRESITIKESQAVQQNIFDYAPNSKVAKDYDDFIKEFLKKERAK